MSHFISLFSSHYRLGYVFYKIQSNHSNQMSHFTSLISIHYNFMITLRVLENTVDGSTLGPRGAQRLSYLFFLNSQFFINKHLDFTFL